MANIEDAEINTLRAAYEQRLEQHIRDVELHLSLPAGTLADIRHDSGYLKILKMHATIEPLLNQALEASVTRALKHPKVNFPGGDAVGEVVLGLNLERKVQLALQCELISSDQAAFIKMLARVRNHYAHSIQNMSLTIHEVAAKISPNDRGLSVERVLYGMSEEDVKGQHGRIVLALMSHFIFNIFAHLIGTVIAGLNPPPAIPGLLLGFQSEKRGELG